MSPVLLNPRNEELKPGWLLPYLLEGDALFCNGRWDYWTEICLTRQVPPGPIPQLALNDYPFENGNPPDDCLSPDTYGVQKTMKHITDLCDRIAGMTGHYTDECFLYLAEWCLYGFNARKAFSRTMPQKVNDLLYTDFQLPRLQQNPFDYPAYIYPEMIGNSARGNGFYPTPANIVRMMVMMTFGDDTEANKTEKVLDPCCGTGIMLLYASNYSLNLYGNDIDPKVGTFAEWSAWLYAPWLAWRPSWESEIEGLFAPEREEVQQAIRDAQANRLALPVSQQAEGEHEKPPPGRDVRVITPSEVLQPADEDTEPKANKRGQFILF